MDTDKSLPPPLRTVIMWAALARGRGTSRAAAAPAALPPPPHHHCSRPPGPLATAADRPRQPPRPRRPPPRAPARAPLLPPPPLPARTPRRWSAVEAKMFAGLAGPGGGVCYLCGLACGVELGPHLRLGGHLRAIVRLADQAANRRHAPPHLRQHTAQPPVRGNHREQCWCKALTCMRFLSS